VDEGFRHDAGRGTYTAVVEIDEAPADGKCILNVSPKELVLSNIFRAECGNTTGLGFDAPQCFWPEQRSNGG
jgi:hypothetical protein